MSSMTLTCRASVTSEDSEVVTTGWPMDKKIIMLELLNRRIVSNLWQIRL